MDLNDLIKYGKHIGILLIVLIIIYMTTMKSNFEIYKGISTRKYKYRIN